MLNDKRILVTGGTGYFGQKFVHYVLQHYKPERIVIFSRDEHKQEEMAKVFGGPRMRYFIGDVRDPVRLLQAMEGIQFVVHAAAMKRVPQMEYNPQEAVHTNIDGTLNVIWACKSHKVQKAVFLSTDKAVHPVNLYGGTKMVAERLWLNANYYHRGFNVVRYGNVMGSRGSVLERFQTLLADGKKELPITDKLCSRFWVDPEQAVKTVITSIGMLPGQTLIPKCPAFKVTDLAHALYMRAQLKEIGLRPGEKIHETLISPEEAARAYFVDDYYCIVPEGVYDETLRYPVKDTPRVPWTVLASDGDMVHQMNQADIRAKLAEEKR